MAELKDVIRARALEFGFDAVGFARAEAGPDEGRHLRQYLSEGRHGDMEWMAWTAERRADPKVLWPEARTVICLGVNYGPAEDPRAVHGESDRGAISVYARGRDYHEVLKKRLKAFAGWLAETHACGVKVFVDTAPVMEKPLAMRAGLGWIGKHTNLVSRRFGSWLFLGEVFTTLELPADPPEVDHCGSCDACVRACPTGALDEPYRIEPRRCVSYLTIEHAGDIAPELTSAFGNRIYGCDDCLAACPWNKFAMPTPHVDLRPRADLTAPKLADLARLDDASFRVRFSRTAVKRIGRDRMLRNVRIAIRNAGSTPAIRKTASVAAEVATSPPAPEPVGSALRGDVRSEFV
jgi:epoxyqueuosine reductase